jgi:serine/threonine protein kinase
MRDGSAPSARLRERRGKYFPGRASQPLVDGRMNAPMALPNSHPPVPESIAEGRYVLHELLGTGGMASVYRVTDTWFGVDRALKLLLPHNARVEKTRARFVHEARTMAVMDHPNIVRIQDVGEENNHYYFVMELSRGGSLSAYLSRYKQRPPLEALMFAVQALRGLQYAHAAGVVHRDVKPHNMLMAEPPDPELMTSGAGNTIKLVDFGIARIVAMASGARLTGTGDTLGTLAYMSPEQRADPRRAGPEADIYGVGATLYILVTGRRPFDLAMANLDPTVMERLPSELRELIRRSTAHRPDDRYPSAGDMADAAIEAYIEISKRLGRSLDEVSLQRWWTGQP